MTMSSAEGNRTLGVTSNLDKALEALGAHDVARELRVTRSLDEAIKKIRETGLYQPGPDDMVEAVVREGGVEDMEKVYRLLHDAYVERGYIESSSDEQCRYNSEFDGIEETKIFVVESQGQLLGSISLTVDGKRGLPVDRDFGVICNLIRRKVKLIGCAWRLVTRHGYADERKVVMILIGEVVRSAIGMGVDVGLSAMNPKHTHCYERLLHMRPVGYCKNMKGLRNAPGVCMRADLDKIPDCWKKSNPSV